MRLILFLSCLTINVNAKTVTLLFRSDISKGFNVPYDSKLFDSSPVSSPRGDVAIYFPQTKSSLKPAVWMKSYDQKRGKIQWEGNEGETVSELGITKDGDICFAHYNKDLFIKAFTYVQNNGEVYTINQVPKNWTHASALPKNTKLNCHFTVKDFDGTKHIVNANFLEQQINAIYSPHQMVSYLFTPISNFNGNLFFKTRIGNKGEIGDQQPDQLIMWADKAPTLLLSDKDDDKSSSLHEFSHLLSANSNGDLSFYGNHFQNLFVLNNLNQLSEILLPNGDIELFTPVINNKKQIAIRHKFNGKNQVSLWKPTKNNWSVILKEGQQISGDIGPLTIRSMSGPAFAGGLAISNKFVFLQVHFIDYKGLHAGEGLVQIEF